MNAPSSIRSAKLTKEELIGALPYARRYARALAGSQAEGDALVADALRQLDASAAGAELSARHILYEAVTSRFNRRHHVSGMSRATDKPDAGHRLGILQRQLLLLTALESVKLPDAARLLGLSDADAAERLANAREQLRSTAAADILIIEDEPIIAMDIEGLVQSCGHRVIGVASSEAQAVEIAARTRPGLILADINLGIGGDGASAVARILRLYHVPVIFVTAYPERLLTGVSSEPAFVITKPFEPLTLAIATYQAVTGGVVLT